MQLLTVVFAGTPEFSVPTLEALIGSPHHVVAVYTQPDRPAGRGRKPQASAVKRRALAHDLPVYQPTSLKPASERQRLAELAPDVLVVVAYGLILPRSVLQIPRLGCLNVHASLLPRWRGAAPIQRALLAGDPETGITIMQMDAGLDTGDMLQQVACPIGPRDTAASLHDRLAGMGATALVDTLTMLEAGTAHPVPQDDAQATYARKIDKGEALIEWDRPAPELERQVRAFNPWPVAQTSYKETMLRIWDARAMETPHRAPPGTVVSATADGIDVATGRGVLRLLTVQLPGKTPVAAGDFVNANAVEGVVLGG